mgnify:FL=1
MFEAFMIIGFALAAYSAVANDSIQTLGTFLASNAKRPWWLLWIWISGIMLVTLIVGWMINSGDPAFGRLSASGKNIPHPNDLGLIFSWLYVIPPIVLVLLTRSGIPVSTTLLLLTSFKGIVAQQQGKSTTEAVQIFESMMKKSLVGYGIAFLVGLLVFMLVLHIVENKVQQENESEKKLHPLWTVFQWLSTGFLWSMWLIQDLANIFVYLPRQLSFIAMLTSVLGMVAVQGYIIRNKGGKIQRVVTSKTNTLDVRSATLIDFIYGLILLFFKVDYIPNLLEANGMSAPWPTNLPMSTTWIFLGLLAGREIGIALKLRHRGKKRVAQLVLSDAGKATFGSLVAVGIALLLPYIATLF